MTPDTATFTDVGQIRGRAAVTPQGRTGPVAIEVRDDGRIAAIEALAAGSEVPDVVLVPGFVDLQCNGLEDVDVALAEGGDWDRLDRLLAARGTTTWFPTLITAPLDAYAAPLARIDAAAGRGGVHPAIAGVHLEGPFLGSRPGAHPIDLVVAPDPAWIHGLPPVVRIITLGAEVDGATDAIGAAVAGGRVAAVGHSSATFEQAVAAVDAGARLVTHAFNAMSGLDHRAPGLVGALLTDDRVATSLIVDLVHVHPAVVDLTFRCKPWDRLVLVSDSVAWRAGHLAGAHLELVDGAPRRPDGTLAGSALGLDVAVANAVHHCGVSLERAVHAASTAPAALLGLADRGALEVGRRADVVALDPASLTCVSTWIGGEPAPREP